MIPRLLNTRISVADRLGHRARRDIEKYLRQPRTSEWVFFDRGVVDALGMLHEVSALSEIEVHNTRFVPVPPVRVHPASVGRDLRH